MPILKFLFLFPLIILTATTLTYLCETLSKKYNILIDSPTKRSSHSTLVPRSGGIAMVITFVVFLIAANRVINASFLGYALGLATIILVGLLDDLYNLKGYYKIAGMLLAAVIPIAFGARLHYLDLVHNNQVFLTILSVIWGYGMINAFNFMDGIDGLIAGIGVICSFFLCALAVISQDQFTVMASLIIMGSCSGFLLFNYSPASIFMGDTGSMFLGYNFAYLSLHMTNYSANHVPIHVIFLIFAVIIYDSMTTFVGRMIKRKNVIEAHRDHLYQRLIILGYSHRRVSILYYLLTFVLGSYAFIYFSTDYRLWMFFYLILIMSLVGFSWVVKRLETAKKIIHG